MDNKVRSIFQNLNFVDLTLYQYGYQTCEPLHRNGPAVFNHFIFHYVRSGKGQLYSTDSSGNENCYRLEAGQGFLIWPKQKNIYIANEYDPWDYAWVEFDGLRAKELITLSGLTFDYPVYIAQNEDMHKVLAQEIAWITANANENPLKLIGHLYLFLDALIASSSVKRKVAGGSLRDFYVREALNYIQQHYAEPLTVEMIADYCKINRNYLGRIFRSVLSASPQEFIITYRMKKACELLKITDLSIGEVSQLVGYPNQLNFSRTFKKEMGKSPREWCRENHIR